MNIEQQYLAEMYTILNDGYIKTPQRVDFQSQEISSCSRTKMLPHIVLRHDMAQGFPLFTHRKMPIKSAAVELEGFIKGITSKKWYQQRGCKYWDHWTNPHGYTDDDLGAIYPHSWRRFGEGLDPDDNGVIDGADQLKSLIQELQMAPDSRRGVVVNWNPLQLSRASLPPCHISFVVTSSGMNNEVLNLMFTQRSCDFPRGHNIHTYALLLLLICSHLEKHPGLLTACYCDAHIYERDWDVCSNICMLPIKQLPKLSVPQKVDLFEWTHKDMKITDYESGPLVKFPEVEV